MAGNPALFAEQALAAIDPSTAVSLDGTATVAGRDAHELVLEPRDVDSLVGSVRIAVDAARCATDAGRFAVDFVRFKETAPDMHFTEQFTWTPGEIEIVSDFAADEAVADYTIVAAACPCR